MDNPEIRSGEDKRADLDSGRVSKRGEVSAGTVLAFEYATTAEVRFGGPTPATHVIFAQLKAGETVYQAGELPETLRVSKIHYDPPN